MSDPYQMDFADYVNSRGGTYLPFPRAVEFAYFLDWAQSMWAALLAGKRPPASRVADLLRRSEFTKAYLPQSIAIDYPEVSNPYALNP